MTPFLKFILSTVLLLAISGRRFGVKGFGAVIVGWLAVVGLTGVASSIVSPVRLFLIARAFVFLAIVGALVIPPFKFNHWVDRGTSKWLTGFLVFALSTFIPFGTLEWVCRALTDSGQLKYYEPLKVVAANHEDWRLFHVTSNQGVEADPVLFWQPRAFRPYTRQRMRGTVAELPKPADVYRVMTYGDSNTDGPPEGGAWPERLGAILSREGVKGYARVELLNAGVTGYSSYQGFLRFKQQVEKYRPDLIFVSFGWNDASPALGKPDREFLPPNATAANILRNLYRFRFFLVLKHYFSAPAAPLPTTPAGPRVSLADYETNLNKFLNLAEAHHIKIYFLTRPHRPSEAQLKTLRVWRREVPFYNQTVKKFSAARAAPLIDVQKLFADHSDLFVDECHFTQGGHVRMAEILFERIKSF